MLRALALRDFVIVEALDLELAAGFSALTGETGAGKSILVDALGLALGERADPGVIRAGAARAEIAAEFDRVGIDLPVGRVPAETAMDVHRARLVIAAKHPGKAVLVRHHGAVENAIGSWGVQDMKTYKIAPEQPYIHRLTQLGVEAERRGKGLAFAHEVSRLIFGGTRDWHLGEHLAQAAQRAGLDLASMDAAIANPASHRATIEENQEALAAAGHWGVPTFVFEGEPFFGEDRIDTLRWRLGKRGLQQRN